MRIALVDDEKNVRLAIKTALKQEGFDIVEFANGQEAFDNTDKESLPDLYVLDIIMPVMDGITLLRKLREKGISTPVMFLTSKDEEFDSHLYSYFAYSTARNSRITFTLISPGYCILLSISSAISLAKSTASSSFTS